MTANKIDETVSLVEVIQHADEIDQLRKLTDLLVLLKNDCQQALDSTQEHTNQKRLLDILERFQQDLAFFRHHVNTTTDAKHVGYLLSAVQDGLDIISVNIRANQTASTNSGKGKLNSEKPSSVNSKTLP